MTFPTPLAASFAVLVFGLASSFPASAQDPMSRDIEFRESLSRGPDAGGVHAEEPRPLGAQRREGMRGANGRLDQEARLSRRRREGGR